MLLRFRTCLRVQAASDEYQGDGDEGHQVDELLGEQHLGSGNWLELDLHLAVTTFRTFLSTLLRTGAAGAVELFLVSNRWPNE